MMSYVTNRVGIVTVRDDYMTLRNESLYTYDQCFFRTADELLDNFCLPPHKIYSKEEWNSTIATQGKQPT